MKIAISLLTLNNLTDVKFTLDSLLKSDIMGHDITLFLYNNAVNPEFDVFYKYLNSLEMPYCYISSLNNDGIVLPRIEVYNEIIKQNEGYKPFDYLLEIHDDMLFPSEWINNLLKYDSPENAIIMPFIFGSFNMDLNLGIVNEVCQEFQENKVYNKLVQNHPWLVRMDVLKQVGYYDADFSPQICEDDELYYRILKAGYNTVTTKESVVFHIKSNTRSWALPLDLFNMVTFASKAGMSLEQFKRNYLHFDSDDKRLFQGEFAWIMQALPLPYSLSKS